MVNFTLCVNFFCIYFHSISNCAVFFHPVFISKFKIITDAEKHDNKDPGKGLKEAEESDEPRDGREEDIKVTHGEDEDGEGDVEPSLDEDGDLDITHRYGKLLFSQQLKHSGLICEGVCHTSGNLRG